MSTEEQDLETFRLSQKIKALEDQVRSISDRGVRIADAYANFAEAAKKQIYSWKKGVAQPPSPPVDPPQVLRETLLELYAAQFKLDESRKLLKGDIDD